MEIEIGDDELENLMDFVATPPTSTKASKVKVMVTEHVKDGTEIINEDAALPARKAMVVISDTDIKDESEDEDAISDDLLAHAMQMSADMDELEEMEDDDDELKKGKKGKGKTESMQFEID